MQDHTTVTTERFPQREIDTGDSASNAIDVRALDESAPLASNREQHSTLHRRTPPSVHSSSDRASSPGEQGRHVRQISLDSTNSQMVSQMAAGSTPVGKFHSNATLSSVPPPPPRPPPHFSSMDQRPSASLASSSNSAPLLYSATQVQRMLDALLVDSRMSSGQMDRMRERSQLDSDVANSTQSGQPSFRSPVERFSSSQLSAPVAPSYPSSILRAPSNHVVFSDSYDDGGDDDAERAYRQPSRDISEIPVFDHWYNNVRTKGYSSVRQLYESNLAKDVFNRDMAAGTTVRC